MSTCLLIVLWACLSQLGDAKALFERTTDVVVKEGMVVGRGDDGWALKRSKRGWMWNQFFLLEEYTGSDYQYVGKLHSDQDKGDGTLKYVLSGDGAGSLFLIDENSGDIHATKRLDREEKAYYTLRAQAVNKRTGRPVEPESQFVIKIHDINDNEPKFTKDTYIASVPEMSDVGTPVVQVTATDDDDATYGNSARVVYSILQGQPYFSVEPDTGIIRTALANMNRENKEKYQVVIQAKDMAGQIGGLSGTATVNISLSDVNDNPPRFPQGTYQFSTPESTEVGSPVGRIKANDADVGENAEVKYNIIGGDGVDMFDIMTDKDTQEGVITVKRPLDYERKKIYTIKVQAENTHLDPRFLLLGPFKDTATVKITVEDVDEPPVFERASYIMEVKEDASIGTLIGSVIAADPDASKSLVRYSIDRLTDLDRMFNIHSGNGSIITFKHLDRESFPWHNITLTATEINNPKQVGRVPVYIRILDINDNAPEFATFYETFVCENAKAGQRIQTVSAVDNDDPIGGHKFFFSLPAEASVNANFTVRDNKDNTAGILTRQSGFSRMERSTYLVPVVISDGGYPMQSSTSTLTIRVCTCDREGNMQSCNAEPLILPAGLSTGALIAILLCIIILLIIVMLFAGLRRQKKKEPLIISKEDVRDNIVSYNDEGGGEEDTQAFDIGTLRNPEAIDDNKLRRDIIPETLFPSRRTAPTRDNADVRDFINQRLQENDTDPTAPPYDSLATYAYEGNGSIAESLSSLESATTEGDQDYNYLSEWGPRFKKLADMYGGEDSDKDS
ncbi:cadherin-10-like [Acipenser oxyrinchus oxyrinchus]|uniref:Cadherin-10 n=1 Tax=Acipenser oxyrinchus oxyrinchus TaxID=40147 RepID=A0AAD8GCX7_ACIOX|nr:cadherin-10-like [Acipenser oxyrinchus oxyrinchus]